MNKFIIITLLILLTSCQFSEQKPEKNNPENNKEIYELTKRIAGKENANKFVFEKNGSALDNDEFEITFAEGKVHIKGNSNIALASGLNWYLKYYASSQISWNSKQIDLPEILPVSDSVVTKKSPFKYSFRFNYCSFNYTMAFWDWKRWEEELDLMALHGFNLSLAIVGTEAVWRNTLKQLGFTKTEIAEFIPGPAFNAWWLMGNLEGWGGPVSDKYIDRQAELQNKILSRMKALGIKPVLQGFYGMVPNELKNKFPKADIRDQGYWAGGFKRPAFLSPNDSLFNKIAKIYYQEIKKLYGDVEFFSGDPFHEGGSARGINLANAGKNIIGCMKEHFPKAHWLFQAWGGNPKSELIRNLNKNDIIILDLDADNNPQWENTKGWNDKQWIWCSVTNYGGNTGLFGRMDIIANEPYRALNSKYSEGLKGIGIMMEGFENNFVIFDLLSEIKWHNNNINLEKWLPIYIKRRYGKENKNLYDAWQVLWNTVYVKKLNNKELQQGSTESILCARPSTDIKRVSTWGTSKLYYNPLELLKAWKLFITETENFSGNENFKFDLLDISRQVLANYAQTVYSRMMIAYNNRNKTEFNKAAAVFIQLLNDQDTLLSSNNKFMLGKWLSSAASRATTDAEKKLFEYNARTLITTWSFKDSDLHDYAHKEWSGLLLDFYKPRWEMFIDFLNKKLDGKNPNEPDYYSFESNWTKERNTYPSKAVRNSVKESKRMFERYYTKIKESVVHL